MIGVARAERGKSESWYLRNKTLAQWKVNELVTNGVNSVMAKTVRILRKIKKDLKS